MPMNRNQEKVSRSISQRKYVASPVNFTTFVSARFDHFYLLRFILLD